MYKLAHTNSMFNDNWQASMEVVYPGGLNHLFQRIIFSILGHGMGFLKNCICYVI